MKLCFLLAILFSVSSTSLSDDLFTPNEFEFASAIDENESPGIDEECECGISNRFRTRIVGGERAPIIKYPWVVGLRIFAYQSCGAALINGCFIMTAAHCTKKLRSPSEVSAVMGTDHRYDFMAKKSKIVEIIRHPKYDPNNTHDDIALLRVHPPIKYTDRIRPICLPKEGDDYLGKSGTVIGFGYMSEDGSASSVMRDVDLKVMDKNRCQKVFEDEGTIYPTNLCAGGEKGKDACLGDSGGPLVLQEDGGPYQIIGIVSWGVGCARQGVPGVYTKVNDYLPWIQSVISKKGCCVKQTANEFANENEYYDGRRKHHMWWNWFG